MRTTVGVGALLAVLSAACQSGERAPARDGGPGDGTTLDAWQDGVSGRDDTGSGLRADAGSDLLGDQRIDGVQDASGAVDTAATGGDASATADRQGAASDGSGMVPLVSFEATCSPEAGTAVPFTRPSGFLGCGGMVEPSALLVIESSEQLTAAASRFPCLDTPSIQGISFATSRLVVAPVQGEVRWVNQIGDAVVIAVTLYGGPAPGSQPFPIAVVLPRSSQVVRGRYCQGSSGCVGSICPP